MEFGGKGWVLVGDAQSYFCHSWTGEVWKPHLKSLNLDLRICEVVALSLWEVVKVNSGPLTMHNFFVLVQPSSFFSKSLS